jgi:succinate-acetate transporter protein
MPVLTHEQLHQLLAGLASLQQLNGEVFAQTAFTERGKFNHSHYVEALHDAAGTGDPTNVQELLACMILARTTPHSAQSAARNEAWELQQVRRLFP